MMAGEVKDGPQTARVTALINRAAECVTASSAGHSSNDVYVAHNQPELVAAALIALSNERLCDRLDRIAAALERDD